MASRKRLKHLKGYRLHGHRLFSSQGQGAIRTIKYPIVGEHLEDLTKAIHHDYLHLYGATNINDYQESSTKPVTTVLDFWLESLRLGGIFASKHSALKKIADEATGQKSEGDRQFETIPLPMRDKLDKNTFIATLLLTSGFRNTSTEQSLSQKIIGCFKEEFRKDGDILEIVAQIPAELLKLSARQQKQYIRDKFGIKDMFLNEPKTKIKSSLTFVFLPGLNTFEDDIDSAELIIKVIKRNRELLNTKDEDGLIKDDFLALGLEDNGNALCNFLNDVFSRLLNNDIQSLVSEIIGLVPAWRGKEIELQHKLNLLSVKAQAIGSPQLVANWAEYRHEINGKLIGWLKNYYNQDKNIKTDLAEQVSELERLLSDINRRQGSSSLSGNRFEQPNRLEQQVQEIREIALKLKNNADSLTQSEVLVYSELMLNYVQILIIGYKKTKRQTKTLRKSIPNSQENQKNSRVLWLYKSKNIFEVL
jgi:hypothetical protein